MSSTAPNSLEIDYMASSKNNNSCLKTELSLSLPGSQVLEPSLFDQPNPHPFNSVKNNRSYNTTWDFADASSAGEWGLSVNGDAFFSHGAGKGVNVLELGGGMCKKSGQLKDMDIDVASDSQKPPLDKKPTATAPAAKAQVVGWPPIRSFRKNSVASASTKHSNEADGKSGLTCLYVKVRMDGAPYLRKVDLKLYNNYKELSLALKTMFGTFPVGKDGLGDNHLNHVLPMGSECVLTYEDKDGDWMLVGDVPWDMFTSTCKRLRIMKGSDAIGLAPGMDNEIC